MGLSVITKIFFAIGAGLCIDDDQVPSRNVLIREPICLMNSSGNAIFIVSSLKNCKITDVSSDQGFQNEPFLCNNTSICNRRDL
jgi:hypothetical protein